MKDAISKDTGNGYLLKGATSVPSTFDSFRTALVNGTLPVDINYNASGWQVEGTPLNKANLLSDTTAAAMGLTGEPTVNTALSLVAQSGIKEGARTVVGRRWVSATLPAGLKWIDIAYGAGKYVAIAVGDASTYSTSTAVYSTDGLTWSTITLPVSANWQQIIYAGGKFVAVASGTDTAIYSTNGITWNTATLPASLNWASVAYGNGKYVAIPQNYTTIYAYSTDGITWVQGTLPTSYWWGAVAFGSGVFALIFGSSGSNYNKAYYSSDGLSWTATTMPNTSDWHYITYGNGMFLAIGNNYGASAKSTDGITWTNASVPVTSGCRDVAFGNGMFIIVNNSIEAYVSSDCVTWTTEALASAATCAVYGVGLWVALCWGSDTYTHTANVYDIVLTTMSDAYICTLKEVW